MWRVASLWLDGELVRLEDLVLHDAGQDVRAPTHQLTIARDVLRSRRRIASQPQAWATSPDGLRTLLRAWVWPGPSYDDDSASDRDAIAREPRGGGEGESGEEGDVSVFAAVDAVLARSAVAIEDAKRPSQEASSRAASGRDANNKALVYDLDWDEDARLDEWRDVVGQAQELPPVLAAIVALDAWNELAVSQHAPGPAGGSPRGCAPGWHCHQSHTSRSDLEGKYTYTASFADEDIR
ncbi:DUF1612 domain-containing protein [Rhizobium grahamii]|uniref:DUF1612 domain-containing protein n=1 Tax=Rhizobium grahamii CCGE 502 TaxID=990285 RepID=S3H6M3_9HYPH|nr:putative protein y4cF [Rhizobium grahamii CCGE 502]